MHVTQAVHRVMSIHLVRQHAPQDRIVGVGPRQIDDPDLHADIFQDLVAIDRMWPPMLVRGQGNQRRLGFLPEAIQLTPDLPLEQVIEVGRDRRHPLQPWLAVGIAPIDDRPLQDVEPRRHPVGQKDRILSPAGSSPELGLHRLCEMRTLFQKRDTKRASIAVRHALQRVRDRLSQSLGIDVSIVGHQQRVARVSRHPQSGDCGISPA